MKVFHVIVGRLHHVGRSLQSGIMPGVVRRVEGVTSGMSVVDSQPFEPQLHITPRLWLHTSSTNPRTDVYDDVS